MSNKILKSLKRLEKRRQDTPRIRYVYGGYSYDQLGWASQEQYDSKISQLREMAKDAGVDLSNYESIIQYMTGVGDFAFDKSTGNFYSPDYYVQTDQGLVIKPQDYFTSGAGSGLAVNPYTFSPSAGLDNPYSNYDIEAIIEAADPLLTPEQYKQSMLGQATAAWLQQNTTLTGAGVDPNAFTGGIYKGEGFVSATAMGVSGDDTDKTTSWMRDNDLVYGNKTDGSDGGRRPNPDDMILMRGDYKDMLQSGQGEIVDKDGKRGIQFGGRGPIYDLISGIPVGATRGGTQPAPPYIPEIIVDAGPPQQDPTSPFNPNLPPFDPNNPIFDPNPIGGPSDGEEDDGSTDDGEDDGSTDDGGTDDGGTDDDDGSTDDGGTDDGGNTGQPPVVKPEQPEEPKSATDQAIETVTVYADPTGTDDQGNPIWEYGKDVASEIAQIITDLPSTLLNPTGRVVDILGAVFSPVTDPVGEKLSDAWDKRFPDNPEGAINTEEGKNFLRNWFANAHKDSKKYLTEEWFETLLFPAGALGKLIAKSVFGTDEVGDVLGDVAGWMNTNIKIPYIKALKEMGGDHFARLGNIPMEVASETISGVAKNFTDEEELAEHIIGNNSLLSKIEIIGDGLSAGVVELKDQLWDIATDLGSWALDELGFDDWMVGTYEPNPMSPVESAEWIIGQYNATVREMINSGTNDRNLQPISIPDSSHQDYEPPEIVDIGEGGGIVLDAPDWDSVDFGQGIDNDVANVFQLWDGGILTTTTDTVFGNWQGTGGGTMSEEERETPTRPTIGEEGDISDATAGVTTVTPETGTDDTLTQSGETQSLSTDTTAPSASGDTISAGTATGVVTGTAPTQASGPETALTANTIDADTISTGATVTGATGTLSDDAQAEAGEATLTQEAQAASRLAEKEAQALSETPEYVVNLNSYVDKVTGQTVNISETSDAEAKTRDAITDDTFSPQEAQQIVSTLGYEARQNSDAVKGEAAEGAAISMVAQVGDMPEKVAAAIVKEPEKVQAQIDEASVEVKAAVAALPAEALVSAQMNVLLGEMEEGKTPTWARPAVDKVNAIMASRGLSTSTVGRDALFNAIIQTALPMAQSNAEALQTRAAQNLSNQQQAAVVTAQLDMNRRLANLQNRQTAESQSAQMAQQFKALKSEFDQQAVLTSAEQKQQVRMQNLQNLQRTAEINAANEQQMAVANLSNEQQIELANLEIQATVDRDNMSAKNQELLTEMNMSAKFLSENAQLAQQMKLANMSTSQQMRLANLQAKNDAASENLNAAQQTELANLQKNLNSNLKQVELAQQMNVAQLNVDQQRAMQNATMVANIDLNKFNAAQQVELANSKFMQTMTMAEYDAQNTAILQNATAMASMDLANADATTRVAIENAKNFLAMDMANLDNSQQAVILAAQQKQQRLLSNQSAINAAKQFNATSANQTEQFMAQLGAQIEQFNIASTDAMNKFNASEKNRMTAERERNTLTASTANANLAADISKFNASLISQREQWNAANAQAVEQSNIAWRRQANLADTAALNAANQQNVQNEYNLSSIELSAMWQNFRDQSTFIHNAEQNAQNRMTQLYGLAIGSTQAAGSTSAMSTTDLITAVSTILNPTS